MVRIPVFYNVGQGHFYDASGERIMKAGSHDTAVYENGDLVDYNVVFEAYTSYPNQFLTIDQSGISHRMSGKSKP